MLLAAKGQLREAVSEFETAVKLKPDYGRRTIISARPGGSRTMQTGAIAALKAAAKLMPNHADSHYYLGLALRKAATFKAP